CGCDPPRKQDMATTCHSPTFADTERTPRRGRDQAARGPLVAKRRAAAPAFPWRAVASVGADLVAARDGLRQSALLPARSRVRTKSRRLRTSIQRAWE